MLVRGTSAASVAGAGIRIGRVGEWKQGSRDRGAREGGVCGGSGELYSVWVSALWEREGGVLGRYCRVIRAAEEGESLFRGRRGDSRAGFERGEGEGDRPLEVEELKGEEDDEDKEEEEVPVERRRLREERGRSRISRSGLGRVGLVGDVLRAVLPRGFLEGSSR